MKYHLFDRSRRQHIGTCNDISEIPSMAMLRYRDATPKDAEHIDPFLTSLSTEDGEHIDFRDVVTGKTYLLFVRAKYKVLRNVEYTYEMVEASSSSPVRRGASGMPEMLENVLIAKAKMIYHEEPKWLTHDYHATYELSVTEG